MNWDQFDAAINELEEHGLLGHFRFPTPAEATYGDDLREFTVGSHAMCRRRLKSSNFQTGWLATGADKAPITDPGEAIEYLWGISFKALVIVSAKEEDKP